MYRTHPSCSDCKKSETTIDLTDIPPNSYSPGDYIIGDLKELGWKVVRGVRACQKTNNAIDRISTYGK